MLFLRMMMEEAFLLHFVVVFGLVWSFFFKVSIPIVYLRLAWNSRFSCIIGVSTTPGLVLWQFVFQAPKMAQQWKVLSIQADNLNLISQGLWQKDRTNTSKLSSDFCCKESCLFVPDCSASK